MSKLKSIATRLGLIGEMSKKAESAADHRAVVAEVEAQLEEATRTLASLESRRGQILLDGAGDFASYPRQLTDAKERVEVLRASLTEAQRRRDEAAQREAKEALEARQRQVLEVVKPALKQSWKDAHAYLAGVAPTMAAIQENERLLDDFNYDAKHNDRPDLVIDTEALRAEAFNEIEPVELPPAPVAKERPVKPVPPTRRPGERDADFRERIRHYEEAWETKLRVFDQGEALRFQNHASQAHSVAQRDEPIRRAARVAAEVIESTALAMAPHEAARNRRRIDIQTFLVDGKPYQRLTPKDGRGRPQANPMLEQRRTEYVAKWGPKSSL